jgi:hypothetical protein
MCLGARRNLICCNDLDDCAGALAKRKRACPDRNHKLRSRRFQGTRIYWYAHGL